MLGMLTGAQPLFQIFVWTTSGSFRAPSAPVDTRLFAQSVFMIRGPTVYIHIYMQHPKY